MAAVLFSNAQSPPSSSSSPPPTSSNVPTKSFKMFRSSLQETLRTATRSKAKSTKEAQALVANETGFVNALGFGGGVASSSRLKKDDRSKDKDRQAASKDKGKAKESRPSIDASSSSQPAASSPAPPTSDDAPFQQSHSGLRRLASRTGFGRKKSSLDLDASTSAAVAPSQSRTKGRGASGGWASFMTPSLSAGSMSSPAIHLSSDPSAHDTPASNMSPSTSIGALISPPRPRRPTLTSKDSNSSSPPKPNHRPSPIGTRQPPEPPTFALSSSPKRLPPSPSTPTLGHYAEASSSTATARTARPAPRTSLDKERPPPPSSSRVVRTPSRTRAVDRSVSPGSGSGSGSRSSSPTTTRRQQTGTPTTPHRLKQDRNAYGSISTSHLPSSATSTPTHHARRTSRERNNLPPSASPIPPPPPQTPLYHRRNSSTASFTNPSLAGPSSPPTSSRAISPMYTKGHTRNASSTSLAGVKPVSAQRETMRAAASFVVREMAKAPPMAQRSTATSPYGGLAGAPAGVKVDPWEEVEVRLAPLARLERVWGRSGVVGGSAFGNASSASVNTAVPGGATVSGGGEDRERRVFCEALRDGYVLAQLMNKLNPTSPLPIPRVDPREDGYSKTSNVVKFRDAAKTFIMKSGGDGKDVLKEMFGQNDLGDGNMEGVVKVARVLNLLASLKGDTGATQRWLSNGGSSARPSMDRGESPHSNPNGTLSRNPYGSSGDMTASTPNLVSRGSISPTKKRWSPPSPGMTSNGTGNVSPEPFTASSNGDSRSSSALDRRRLSADKARKLGLGPAPISSPPTPPVTRTPVSPTTTTPLERRSSSSNQYQLSPPPPGTPPNPPLPMRSSLRTAPSLSFASNRASIASSSLSNTTDANTALFENTNGNYLNHRASSSNRFGTIRTMNTIVTDATSILPLDGSWGREDAGNAMAALGLADAMAMEASSMSSSSPQLGSAPISKRRSYDQKSPTTALGLALQQAHPPISSSDLFQDGGGRPARRERRSSEIAIDLTTVPEAATDMEGSIKPRPSAMRRTSDNRGRDTPDSPTGLNLRKGKWSEDYVGLFPGGGGSSPPSTPYMHRSTTEPNPKSILVQELSESPTKGGLSRARLADEDNDATPKGKAPNGHTQPITIVTAASRDPTPREERDDFLSPVQPFRRPTHRAGSLSVDVLLPRPPNERRISIERRVSTERREQLHLASLGHDRDSSSGSAESQTLGGAELSIRRPLRRASTRSNSNSGVSRQGIYLAKRPSGSGDDFGTASGLLPAASSVPAVSHIRVPFPRSSSGDHSPLIGEPLSARTSNFPPTPSRPSDSTIREGAMPSSTMDPEQQLHQQHYIPTRPGLGRPRYQSELEMPRVMRRGSAGVVDRLGSSAIEDDPRMALRGRSRMESLQNGGAMSSSTNLTRASSFASGRDPSTSNLRRTLIVKEAGRAPMHYQLGNCIGKGQFGAVYRALNLNTGQMVAVKRIRLEGLPETEVEQLMKEVDLLKKLKHPSIVSYEGMVRDEDSLDIVLEYVENGSLGQTLKSFGKFNEKLVATYVTKILEGLHYLHEQQVVHCDLKAANILSTKNGNIKLSDFGVSLALNAMESAKENVKDNVAGTPNWMAPEVIELKGAKTASDIWSLGCTVVELLTGRPPYSEIGNSLSVMFRIVDDDSPPIPEGCSEPLQDFLRLCFQKNPADRPTAEVLFEHPWLKRTWGLNEDLRPQDSVPFLRRVSTDLQKSDLARQLSIYNLHEGGQMYDAAKASPRPGMLFMEDPEFVVRPHSFVKTTFSKHVNCRVCHQHVKKSAVLCEECSLICHATCAKDAPPHCDVRAQLLLYAQFSHSGGGSNGSPAMSTSGALPSPGLPIPPSPGQHDTPLSSSPSFHNKLFAWKRNSKSAVSEMGSSVVGSPPIPGSPEDLSHRRSGGFLFRRSEDRSRTRRDSMAGGSNHSSSMRSAVTGMSNGNDVSIGRTEQRPHHSRISTVTPADPQAEAEHHRAPLSATTNTISFPQPLAPAQSSLPNDATRRRRIRKDSNAQSKGDCLIQ